MKNKELKPGFNKNILNHDCKLDKPENYVSHMNDIVTSRKPIPHGEILSQLIEKIQLIDFRKKAELSERQRLTNSDYQIIVVEQVLNLAKSSQWGMCLNCDFIYIFNGSYWKLIDAEDIKTFLGEAALKMGVHWRKANQFRFRINLYKQFLALAYLPSPVRPRDLVLVNLKNGTFEIDVKSEETELRDFDSDDFLTFQLPFEYDENAQCPIFKEYLNKVLPDKERQNILSEFLGYVFINTSLLKLEKALLLYGTGANGKSVFYEVVRMLLGEHNTSEYSLQSLTNENGYSRAMIANKLVNYASEINGKLETSVFKQMVSGEPVEARRPYHDPQIIENYAKLIFNCNELPKDVEQTHAFFRRFLIVPFDVTIPEEEQDKKLASKIIKSELSGVFNWVLEGLTRVLSQKSFSECEAACQALELYKKESDSVKLFLEELEYCPSSLHYELINHVYPKYREFCQEAGYKPCNRTNFKRRLETSGIIVEKKSKGLAAYMVKLPGI